MDWNDRRSKSGAKYLVVVEDLEGVIQYRFDDADLPACVRDISA